MSGAKQTTVAGRARRGGAAYTIAGECERLFCETLRTVFLGEGNLARENSLAMGMHHHHRHHHEEDGSAAVNDYGVQVRPRQVRIMDSPSPEAMGMVYDNGIISDWVEVWDYVGGIRFRGFVAEKSEEKALFVFFDQNVVGGDLKAGLMALLELCEVDYLSCARLVTCIDRHTDRRTMDILTKDLGWIGFQLATLEDFSDEGDIISDDWLFMEMDT